jgi:Flp pilus assembly pilin Flp
MTRADPPRIPASVRLHAALARVRDEARVRTIETTSVERFGSVTLGRGVDSETREAVIYLGDTRTMAGIAEALADGAAYVMAITPVWAVLSAMRDDPYDHDAASTLGQSLAEYGLMLALVVVCALVALVMLGAGVSGLLRFVASSV